MPSFELNQTSFHFQSLVLQLYLGALSILHILSHEDSYHVSESGGSLMSMLHHIYVPLKRVVRRMQCSRCSLMGTNYKITPLLQMVCFCCYHIRNLCG